MSVPDPAERQRRLREKVFGDVLPDSTTDDTDDPAEPDSTDEWLKRQVPPHHG